jgi:peptidoglycan/LPS O-acetylase OafA/YrhL
MKKKIYFENLDGLRFFCFFSVFLYHSFHTENELTKSSPIYKFVTEEIFKNGNLGVNFFFVLSGFLITYLLIAEKKLNGQIDLKKFWIRRILRIWPLFYFCVGFGFLVFPQLKLLFGQVPNETANPIYYVTFLNNFDFIQNGLTDASVLSVLWSIAIEEQFYLIWPIILYLFSVKKYWIPFCLIIIASISFRALNDDPLSHELHTLSCIGDMTVGALGAWLIFQYNSLKLKIRNLNRLYILLIYAFFFSIYFFRDEMISLGYGVRVFERIIIAFVILLIILEQNYCKNSLFKLSSFKQISKLGVITYGLYCLHKIAILVVITITNKYAFNTELWQTMVLETLLALVLTIVMSKLSYKFYESPFLKLKDKFSIFTK